MYACIGRWWLLFGRWWLLCVMAIVYDVVAVVPSLWWSAWPRDHDGVDVLAVVVLVMDPGPSLLLKNWKETYACIVVLY
jgi:hypothetical protein